jgi:prephenate dehydrogenase
MSVAIVGLGLIGGSLARALSGQGVRVLGVDRPAACRAARKARAIAATTSLESAAREAQVLVLAASPRANLRLLRKLARIAPASLVITDVTSVKVPIVREAARLKLPRFVGGHPMAGRERSGFAASTAGLFRGRPWILTGGGDPGARRRVRGLIRRVGARPVEVRAVDHDRLVAVLSHVPQIVSWALFHVAAADRVARRHLDLAGPGFLDMTRLASSPRVLWKEILTGNQSEVRRAMAALRRALSHDRFWG